MAIQLYKQEGWVDTIKGLESFGIVPEIRAQGTISKGVTDAPTKSGGTKAEPRDHFIVHFEPECRVKTKTDPRLLLLYGVKQEELKTLHVSIPSPALSFKTGRFKYGKKSGVLCSSDDNLTGRPLMDLKSSNKVVLHQGADQNCQECPFNKDGSCKETVLVLFTISAPSDEQPAPFGNTLFKMTLPRTARNPFMGDYMLAMEEAYNAVLRYGLDHTHFPQAMIPFTVSLVERSGQYFNEETQSQTKTSYFVPQLHLDQDRLYARLEKFAAQFGGNVLVGRSQKTEVIGDTELKQLIASQKEPEEDEDVQLAREAVKKLWDAWIINDFERTASFKKYCREHGREEMTLNQCQDADFIRAYGEYKQEKLKAKREKKQQQEKAEQQEEGELNSWAMGQTEIDGGRQRIESAYKGAEQAEMLRLYADAVETEDWNQVADLIAATY